MPSIRAWQVMGWPVSARSWAAASKALSFLALVAAPVLAGAGFAALGILVPFTDGVLEVFFVAMMVLLMLEGWWKPAPRPPRCTDTTGQLPQGPTQFKRLWEGLRDLFLGRAGQDQLLKISGNALLLALLNPVKPGSVSLALTIPETPRKDPHYDHRERGGHPRADDHQRLASPLRRGIRRRHPGSQPDLADQTDRLAYPGPGRGRPVRTSPPTGRGTGQRRRLAACSAPAQTGRFGTGRHPLQLALPAG